jgi:hypothetical protein
MSAPHTSAPAPALTTWAVRWQENRLALANLAVCSEVSRADPRWHPALDAALAVQLELLAELRNREEETPAGVFELECR